MSDGAPLLWNTMKEVQSILTQSRQHECAHVCEWNILPVCKMVEEKEEVQNGLSRTKNACVCRIKDTEIDQSTMYNGPFPTEWLWTRYIARKISKFFH